MHCTVAATVVYASQCFCTAAAQDTQSDGCVRAMTPTNNVTARAALVGAVSPGWNVLRTLGEELVCFRCFVPGNEGLGRYFAGVLRLGHDDIVCCLINLCQY